MSHTKEPWHVANGNQIRSERDQIARAWMMRGGEGKENARRIVACVNACAGIPNEVLMTVGAFGGFGRDDMVRHVTKQRDELLAVLEKMTFAFTALATDCTLANLIDDAEAAIASVKGGAA